MMRADLKAWRGLWLGTLVMLLAAPLFADQPMSSANYSLWRNTADGGGKGAGSASYVSTGAVAEQPIAVVAGSTSSSTNWAVGPGLMNIMFFPGRIITLNISASTHVYITSATLQWNTTGYDGGIGTLQPGTTYFIRLATFTVPDTFFFSNADIAISTQGTIPGRGVNTKPVGLLPNATYYASIWTDDEAGNLSFISNRSTFTTGVYPPGQAAPAFTAVWQSSMSAQWTDPGNNQVNQTTYTVIFTSNTVFPNTWVGNILSSTTALSTDTPQGYLDANTTYYLWAQSVNMNHSTSPWAALGSTSSLALPVTQLVAGDYLYVFYTSATLKWAAFPAAPLKQTSEGYFLAASSTNFGVLSPGGDVYLSTTSNFLVSTLTIAGLDLSNTYYFQVGALNHNSAWNPISLTRLNMQISQSTFDFTLGLINPNVFQSTVSMSSMVITNVGNIAATYNVWASTVAPCLYDLSTARAVEKAVLQGQWHSGFPGPSSASFGAIGTNDITVSTATSGVGGLYNGDQTGFKVPPGESRTMWFQFWLPASTLDTSKEHIIVGVVPIYYP